MRKWIAVAAVGVMSVVGVVAAPPSGGATVSAAVTASAPVDVRVASFNIQSVSLDATVGNQRPWRYRRAGVIADILGERADVVGLQEANQSRYWASRLVDGATQMEDLRNGLNKAGGHYRLVNAYNTNCVNYWTTYRCVYKYRGASGADRILYNTDTLLLVGQGATRLTQSSNSDPRYFAWAVLRVKATGRDFLFVNTHLNSGSASVRRAQWYQITSWVNKWKGTRPVVVVGDFNTHRADALAREMLPAMRRYGYGDVLNQTYMMRENAYPRAWGTVNGWLNTWNRLDRNVANWSYENQRNLLGYNIDWVFATNTVAVKQWKVVADYYPSTLRVAGTFPSDHNMVRATLAMP
jgi:endonuclease/exonuclease/phosphatase family metal-dependent hydrolase